MAETSTPTQQKSRMPINLKGAVVPLLVIALIAAAFYIGKLTTQVQLMSKNGGQTGTVGSTLPPEEAYGSAENVVPVSDSDHVRGSRNAKIALIEYSDLECPFCQQFHPTAQQIIDDYPEDVMWVYRHFPLESIHPNARPAAIASECVASLVGEDAFWAFTDSIFMDGTPLSENSLLALASSLGADPTAFTQCVENEETAAAVDEDYQTGLDAGVTGTPGNILLNTETGETVVIPGAVPYSEVSREIDGLL